MRSKLKRSKSGKSPGCAQENSGQTNEVIEISSESDENEAFDQNNLTSSWDKKHNWSRAVSISNCTGQLAPIFLRAKKTSKSGNIGPHVTEVGFSGSNQESDTILSSFLDVRLREVQVCNPTFPVNNLFTILHKKARLKEYSTANAPEKLNRNNKLSRTQRLKYRTVSKVAELNNKKTNDSKSDQQKTPAFYQREPFSEDVLWTDKYRPCQSSEIIGNTAAVEKLHSWLIKWKLKTDVEEKKEKPETQSNDLWDCGDFEDEVGSENETEEQLWNTILISGPSGVGKTAAVYACAMELGFKWKEVLTQLKEATQSHLVEISGKDPLKPAFFSSYNTVRNSPKSDTLPVKTPRNVIVSTAKKKSVQIRSSGKGSAKTNTLTSYFKTKAKADYLYHNGASPDTKPSKSTDPAVKYDHNGRTNKKNTISLILFEEVDIVFKDDVGFLAAIKTLMRTTKRPVILTTNDPLFRERFNSSLNEIIFQTPSMADVCSYLKLVCLAENVHLDPNDVKTLFTVTQGDVRQCLLQLQLWTNSGGGHGSETINKGKVSYKGCSASMLGLQSVTKNNLLKLLQPTLWTNLQRPMTESWRNGFPLLYSNLELLLHVDENKLDNTCSSPNSKMPFYDAKQTETICEQFSAKSEPRSRLSRKKNILSVQMSSSTSRTSQKTQISTDTLKTTNSMTALSDFFNVMSFIDTTNPAIRTTQCHLQEFVWTGVKIQDGLLDEMKEEEDDTSQELMLDIGATLEALAFHQCWKEASDSREVLKSERSDTFEIKNLNFTTQHLNPHIVSYRLDLSKKILSGGYFSQLHNRHAVCMDYLPVIRLICRTHKKRKHGTEDLVRYFKGLKNELRLTKKTVQLLADEFS
ncbi:hypothetical protein WMY93_006344 [Mugilogobius chulae]|uniref:AAA+ ATPase domain-containing protein n=1 Tax=Mugilogobius chulae TaxID=88201 RepID=A0AAW0PVE1_9GOBI